MKLEKDIAWILSGGKIAYNDTDPEDLFAEVRDWMQFAADRNPLNAVYLDTTTLYTVEDLVLNKNARDLTPATLLDLATFVNSVVLYENIFHLENDHLDSTKINEALGNERVVIPLPVSSFKGEYYGDELHRLDAILGGLWSGTKLYVRQLFPRRPDTRDAFYEDAQEIKEAWQTLLGLEIEDTWLSSSHFDTEHGLWDSAGPNLLEQLVKISNLANENLVMTLDRDTLVDSRWIYDLISECNYRCLFNQRVSNFLKLHYIPNSYRMPFRRYIYRQAQIVQSQLLSIASIEKEYKRQADLYFCPDNNNLLLPFFLSAIFARISSLNEFFEVLAEIRDKARTFRERRADLDRALHEGKVRDAASLRSALDQEGENLRSQFPYVPIAAAIAAVLAALGGATTPVILTSIGILTLVSQFPPQEVEKLKQRILSPQFWFLQDMKDLSLELTNAYPKVCELWGKEEDVGQEIFAQRFARLAKLGH